jgi:hypothetical protein
MSKKATPAKKPTKTAKKTTASKSKAVKNGLKQVTLDEFKEALLEGRRGYVKKPNSWKRYHLWWDDLSDIWFMNWAEDVRSGGKVKQEGIGFLNANSIEHSYDQWAREGYQFYLDA